MAKLSRHRPGHQVVFANPETGEPEYGEIIDEVWARDPEEFEAKAPKAGGWRQGAFLAQLIKWKDADPSVRITYYLRPEGGGADSWYFGGQYSASMSLDEFHSLMRKMQAKAW